MNDKNVHYREWGSGDKVIIALHGWPASSGDYTEFGPTLAKSGYRIIVPDFPGWGKTPEPTQAWNVSDYKTWVEDLTNELNLTRFTLFGHSFGGRVAIKYAIEHPYKVNSLILCAAAGIKPDAYTVKRRFLKLLAIAGKKTFKLPIVNNFSSHAKKFLYRLAGSNDYLKADGVMKETIVKVLEEDLTPLLTQISLPTFVVWGSEDGATPLADGQKIHSLVKQSKLYVFEGQKHNLPKNIPIPLAQQIAIFLKENNEVIS